MSKRSIRRKRQHQKQKNQSQLTVTELVNNGLQALTEGNYNKAIEFWTQARHKKDAPNKLTDALAEAYFRQAISKSESPIDDLQQAIKLQPNEARYRYHQALAYHRQGNLTHAEPIYRQLLAQSPPYQRAAPALAQLLIQQKKPLSKDAVWSHLTSHEQAQLALAEGLIRKKANSTLSRLQQQSNLAPLWHGLVAFKLDHYPEARQQLEAALKTAPQSMQGIIHYYLGVIDAMDGRIESAGKHWQETESAGHLEYHVKVNQSKIRYHQALALRKSGQMEEAFDMLNNIYFKGLVPGFSELHQQLSRETAYQAAQKNNWAVARKIWEKLAKEGDNSRNLIFNLALAYQNSGFYLQAADYWRQILRRRPRKKNHPDALSDEQVSRIWQSVADNYAKAGDYEEAIKTYKNALKWSPGSLDLRLKLVEAYQTEGRWQAGINLLNRILEEHPDNIQALTLLAESYSDDWLNTATAVKLWKRILELEPQNPVAKQQLALSYEQQARLRLQWRHDPKGAIEIYKEGLQEVPDSQRLLMLTGFAYIDLDDLDQTRHYFEQALSINPHDLNSLLPIYMTWVQHQSEKDIADTFEMLKALPPSTPFTFFIEIIDRCIEQSHTKQAREVMAHAESRYNDVEEALVELARGYVSLEENQSAIRLLKSVIEKNPDHAEANLHLGTVYFEMDQTRLGKRYWKKAENIARKTNNQMLLYELKTLTDYYIHGVRKPSSPFEMLRGMPPELLQQLLEGAPPEVIQMVETMGPEALFAMMAGMEGEFYD